MQLIAGQKIALSPLIQQELQFSVQVQCRADFEVDVASFALGQNDQLYHDDYMTFYNQPQKPKQEVQYCLQQHAHIFEFQLSRIDVLQTPRFVICATVSAPYARIQHLQHGQVDLLNAQGQGFNDGLKALIEYFGCNVAKDTAQNAGNYTNQPKAQSNPSSSLDLKKKMLLDKVGKSAAHFLDLTKKSLIGLEKNKLLNVKARVALVLDYSGSIITRISALATGGESKKYHTRITAYG